MSIALYSCDRVRDMLYDDLDGTLPRIAALRLKLHLWACVRCREYMRLYRLAADMRAFRKDNPPPTDFMDRTLDYLERQGIAASEPPDFTPGGPIRPEDPAGPDADSPNGRTTP
jgi:hypothetical protein